MGKYVLDVAERKSNSELILGLLSEFLQQNKNILLSYCVQFFWFNFCQ